MIDCFEVFIIDLFIQCISTNSLSPSDNFYDVHVHCGIEFIYDGIVYSM